MPDEITDEVAPDRLRDPILVNPLEMNARVAPNGFQQAVIDLIASLLNWNADNKHMEDLVARSTFNREFRTIRVRSHRRAGHTTLAPIIVGQLSKAETPPSILVISEDDIAPGELLDAKLFTEAFGNVTVVGSGRAREDGYAEETQAANNRVIICIDCDPPKWAYNGVKDLILVLN